MTYRGVLFDMDGVVLDSGRLWTHIIEDRRKKYSLDQAILQKADGYNLTTAEAITMVLKGMGIWSESLLRKMLDETDEMYTAGLSSMTSLEPGIPEILSMLKKRGIPAVLASNSSRFQVNMALDHYCLKDYFSGVVTSDDVQRGKPDPEPYLKALELAGIGKREAVVVEDSLTGAESAANAGIDFILVSDDSADCAEEPAAEFPETCHTVRRYSVRRSGLAEMLRKMI